MAAVNQRIANFLGGVSQQPDSIKYPGQLRVCDNAIPDVTFGLKKRPPGEFMTDLPNANATGYWYEILRDGDEKFLMQITPGASAGTIRIWNLEPITVAAGYYNTISGFTTAGDVIPVGTEFTVTNTSSALNYLAQASGSETPYCTQTIQDFTIIGNPNTEVGTTGNTAAPIDSGNYAFAKLTTVAHNTEYVVYTDTAPSPNTWFRVTALRAVRMSGGSDLGSTWTSGSDEPEYAGQSSFSFNGGSGSAITLPGGQVATDGIEGHITVNATAFVESYDPFYSDDSDSGNDQLAGYIQDYDHEYTVQVTLQNRGIIKTTTEATALAVYADISIEGNSYRIHVESVEPFETYEGVAGIAFYKTPKNPDRGPASMTSILDGLHENIDATFTNLSARVIGSGLYLWGSDAPDIGFQGGNTVEGMTVFSRSVTNVGELPTECEHGYIVEISNAENVDTDSYYMKFLADNGTRGMGRWEETVRPHNFAGTGSDQAMVKGLDPSKMPHALINNRTGSFEFRALSEANAGTTDNFWNYREVGDNITNPMPSFNGSNIQEIFFYRNRLGFIANEQVVLSRPSDYFNFFIVSALTTSDDNPVDITVSDQRPAFINHVLPINQGAMLFGDNAQFLLFSDSDLFTPKTARLKKISSYESDPTVKPVDLGTTVMFTSSVSAYSRAFEAVVPVGDTTPQIIEKTKVIPEYLPNDITTSCNSTALGVTSFGKKNSNVLYHYKFYNSGQKQEQSSWYSWTLLGTLQHMFYTTGNLYTVELTGVSDSKYRLHRYEYIADATAGRSYTLGGTSSEVGDPLKTARWFEACLDSMVIPTAISYTPQGGSVTGPDFTDLTLPYTPHTKTNFVAIALSGTDTNGNDVAGQVYDADSVATNKATFENINMTGWTVACGYKYTTTIELPSYYLRNEQGSDLNADLRISAINLEMGVSGPMEFHQSSTYADMADFIQYESGMKLDDSDFGKPPSKLMKSVRVPIQKKNDKYNLTIKIPDPFSTAIISGSWDGIYNPRRHARQ